MSELVSLYAEDPRTHHRVFVGRGTLEDAESAALKWREVGYLTDLFGGKLAKGRRRPFAEPYAPVMCPWCEWAGLNLRQHADRRHGSPLPPGIPAVAEVARTQARRARGTADANRVPRAGLVVVFQPSDVVIKVYRIERVEGGRAELYPFDVRERADIARITNHQQNTRVVELADLLTSYQPVGSWKRQS